MYHYFVLYHSSVLQGVIATSDLLLLHKVWWSLNALILVRVVMD